MPALVNELWEDPVLVQFQTLAAKDVFRYDNDAYMKVTDGTGNFNCVNLDKATLHSLGGTVEVESKAAKLVNVTS